jgi:predicted DNA binding CopG/RHH family protein
MSNKPKLELMPPLTTDEEAERFIDEVDLTDFDLSGGTLMRFEFDRKDTQVNLRMPKSLLDTVKQRAKARGIPYQRFIRETLEKALSGA